MDQIERKKNNVNDDEIVKISTYLGYNCLVGCLAMLFVILIIAGMICYSVVRIYTRS